MNKASGGDGILTELFQVLKYDAVKVLHSICQQICKTQQWPQTEKGPFSFQSQRKAKSKLTQTIEQLHSSHTLTSNAQNSPSKASTVCELRTSRCSSWVEKRQRNQTSNCQDLLDHSKSKRVPEKDLFLLNWLCQSLWLCGSQQTVENSSRDGNTRPPYLPPEKSVCRSRSNS